MDPTITIVVGLGLVIFNAFVFYMIIRDAVSAGTQTPKHMKHVWAQTELLILIARQQGADDNMLKSITDHLK